MKKQITVTEVVLKELEGTKIAKYLMSIGVYKETATIKKVDVNEEKNN
ncbi:hypothetical protein NDK43_09280 [Neobacillus pocheonensis]|uniref:Uncharacterized protein n=1 Tax=Neobacillus pocheonensis TaxID=363869 RepID=A0ABT0WAN5_9BACI|nr:hypothetical protein [Neobacillus pocheonensis]